MKILLVDDEQELVSTMAERLAIRGIQADWVISGKEALTQAEAESYDIAVLDIKMPGFSGLSLKKKLQKRYPAMKFIFITGHGSDDDYKEGSQETGAEYYLVKPVDIQTLIEKIKKILPEEDHTQ